MLLLRRPARFVLSIALTGLTASLLQPQARPREPYRDPRLPVETRVRDLLGRMTLEEKFWQLFMVPGDLDTPTQDWSHGVFGLQISPAPSDTGPDAARDHTRRINAIQRYFVERTRLGIPIIPFEEAVHGLVREGATVFPQAIALAASWDTTLAADVAAAIAKETRTRGVRQVLSPVVNIANDVRWGRVEETYGEDPVLASSLTRAYVGAMQQAGIVATPKHFVANVGDGGRDSYPIELSRRGLAEEFFPPFETAVRDAHAGSIMSAYNSVDGVPATQNRWLLTDVLRKQWGFRGFVISDAAATGGAVVLHLTEPNTPVAAQHAFAAGLDVVFQSSWGQYRPYWEAFRQRLVPPATVDSAVARVLRAKFSLELFEFPYADEDSAAKWNGNPAHRELARRAAREGIVLLQNTHGLLPLTPRSGSVAVIGTDAVEARLGGYSGPGTHRVSILDAIREKVGGARVGYAPGPGRVPREVVAIPAERLSRDSGGRAQPGLRGEYFDNIALQGSPRLVRTDPRVDFGWTLNGPARGIPLGWYSVRWTGRVTIPKDGVRRIGVEGSDGWRLYLDGTLLIDNWRKQSARRLLTDVSLEPGRSYEVRLEFFESVGPARVRLVWDAGVVDDHRAAIDDAVTLAQHSDVAVVVAGIEEGEFRDRSSLRLPGYQEQLIQEVAAAGKPVVVVLIGGSAITMAAWLDRVDAVLDAWYPGEQGGPAVADVLFGEADPGGRLPITFPVAEGQLPLVYNHLPTGRGDDYLDLTGQPLFPFGFGLSYATFEYSGLAIEPVAVSPTGSATVRCRVRNTGSRPGEEVVQLYLRDLLASTARPVMQIEGFRRVSLGPGEEAEVTFSLGPEQLRMQDREGRWVVEPGTFRVLVGASSRDIRLRGELVVR